MSALGSTGVSTFRELTVLEYKLRTFWYYRNWKSQAQENQTQRDKLPAFVNFELCGKQVNRVKL